MTTTRGIRSVLKKEIRDHGRSKEAPRLIGILKGEGIGPDVIDVSLAVLEVVTEAFGRKFEVRFGGAIGAESERLTGKALTEVVANFCDDIFEQEGAILAGAGGGRFVYEMRRRFDLFVKVNPLIPFPELEDAAPARPQRPFMSDVLVVRDNRNGLYQGRSRQSGNGDGCRVSHEFGYVEREVLELTALAAELAACRSTGRLTVVSKESGLPELSQLWIRCAQAAAEEHGVELRKMDIDFAAYQLIANPGDFDVIVTPNCFGDILSDLGGLLMGSRGITYGASYSPEGRAVYQTNHGAAYELAGKNVANPVGQILSLAMLLNESFGMRAESAAILCAVRQAWRDGWRTADVIAPGRFRVGCAEMGAIVAEKLAKIASMEAAVEAGASAY